MYTFKNVSSVWQRRWPRLQYISGDSSRAVAQSELVYIQVQRKHSTFEC